MKSTITAGSLSLLMCIGTAANAATVSYRVTMEGDPNLPRISLYNTSTTSHITEFRFGIGDTSRNFDNALMEGFPPSDYTQLSPDDNGSGGVRSDAVRYTFPRGAFVPGDIFSFRSDVDRDSINSYEDFRHVLFDVGGPASATADNSLIFVRFSNGLTLQRRVPEFARRQDGRYGVGQSQTYGALESVPEPGAAGLLVAGMALVLGNFARGRFRTQP